MILTLVLRPCFTHNGSSFRLANEANTSSETDHWKQAAWHVCARHPDRARYTGSDQHFIVPANIAEIEVKVWGAGAGGGDGGNPSTPPLSAGGAGGFVSGKLAVTPGEEFSIVVGEGGRGDGTDLSPTYGFGGIGAGKSNGQDGGGLSGIFTGTSTVLDTDSARAVFIAGGGGAGERGPGNWSKGGQGGDPVFGGGSTTMQGASPTASNGGGGGGGYQGGIADQTRMTNDPSNTTHGEGGSNFIHPSVSSPLNLATPDVAGPDEFTYLLHDPPETEDPDYIPFAGQGSSETGENTKGEDGLVVIIYTLDYAGEAINYSLDLDSDNDGIPDNIEAQTTQGYIAPSGAPGTGFIDIDGDGLDDNYDADTSNRDPILSLGIIPVNSEGLDNPDHLDNDSDNDGILDIDEAGIRLADNDIDDNGLTDNVTGDNGLEDSNGIELDDDYTDVNGMAHDGTGFTLSDTDNDVPNGADYDYRDIPQVELFGTHIMTALQEGTVTPNKIDAYLNIVANNWGVVITRVNGTGSITTPVEGMLIYDTSDNSFKVCIDDTTPTWRALETN